MGVVAKPKVKAYVSDFKLVFNPLSINGKLVPVRRSAASTKPSYKLASPAGNPVKQVYIDVVTETQHAAADCNRMVEAGDGEITVIDKEVLAEIKKSKLPENVLKLTAHPVAEVVNSLYPDAGNGYLLIPNPKDPDNVALATAFAAAIDASPDKAFLGTCNLHGNEGLFRVQTWRGHLVFQKYLYPEEMNDHEHRAIEQSDNAKMIRAFFEKKVEPFNPETYHNASVAAQLAALENPESLKTKPVAAPTESDISSLLASLEDF